MLSGIVSCVDLEAKHKDYDNVADRPIRQIVELFNFTLLSSYGRRKRRIHLGLCVAISQSGTRIFLTALFAIE